MSFVPVRAFVALSLMALAAGGCSRGRPVDASSAGPGTSDALREVGGLLTAYSGQYNRGPEKPADLEPFEAGFPLGLEAVRSGAVVVVWGVRSAGEGEKGGEGVLAYEAKTPTEGGLVLLEDGIVKPMSPDEFKSAPRAAGR